MAVPDYRTVAPTLDEWIEQLTRIRQKLEDRRIDPDAAEAQARHLAQIALGHIEHFTHLRDHPSTLEQDLEEAEQVRNWHGPQDPLALDFLEGVWERGMRTLGWHDTADQLHAIRQRHPLRA